MEPLGQFEILEAKLRDELMTTQSEKNEILVKVKGIQKKIALVTTELTGMKYVKKKLYKYNGLLNKDRNTKPILMKLCAMRIMEY